jgi:hypothetical protein
MVFIDETLPTLSNRFVPPSVLGTADLTGFAYQGNGYAGLMERIDRFHAGAGPNAAERLHDMAIALQLDFRASEGLNVQDEALARCQVFRVGAGAVPGAGRPLRLLALMGPGALMVNTPLDFLTNPLGVRLDLMYLLPDRPLPPTLPDHDVAFFALGEADAATLCRLRNLFDRWPRPALNDPRYLPMLARDTLAASLAGVPGICSPPAVAASRATLEAYLRGQTPVPGFPMGRDPFPCLIRPAGSHAGHGLARAETAAQLREYLFYSFEKSFFVTAFEEYRGPDGLYRKSRIAFIDRRPFLCHMGVSRNWMVHYLNAGMAESAEKRADEARAMAEFDQGFARRHAAAFAALHDRIGFDYYQIDCAETRDGRLLIFEADCAAIVHLMDPADLFPYKQPQMQRVFTAFGDMLRGRCLVDPVRGRNMPVHATVK